MLASSASRQTDKANSFLQVGLTVKLEDGDVVVKGLGVVVVVDVGRRNAEGLSAGAAELLGKVVIAHSYVNCISSSDDTEKYKYLLFTIKKI